MRILENFAGTGVWSECIRENMSTWVKSQNWDYFLTLTTAYESTPKSMRRLAERWHGCTKNISVQNSAPFFWVMEKHQHRGYHLHGLINVYGRKSSDAFPDTSHLVWTELRNSYVRMAGKESWHRNHIVPYNSNGGAEEYCVKYLTKNLQDWDYFF